MKNSTNTFLDKRFYLLSFIAIGALLFIVFNTFDLSIKLTLLSELILILLITYYYLYYDQTNIANCVIIVFFLLFFVIAPSIQLGKHTLFLVNTLPIDTSHLFYVNILAIIFLFSFGITYLLQANKTIFIKPDDQNTSSFFTLSILILLSIFVSGIAINEMLEKISTFAFLSKEEDSTIVLLLRKKFLYNIPLATLLYTTTLNYKSNRQRLLLTIVILGLVILTKNPLLEKRSGLGPTYLMLLYILRPEIFKSNLRILATFVSIFIVLFPLSSILTHSSIYTWDRFIEVPISSIILEHFNSLHYDAWSNVDSAVRYTQDVGFRYGLQITGVILFFVPRFIWIDKPVATGHLVGEYLIDTYSMWFDNLSSPIISEAYVDFGIIGVIFYGALLAIIIKQINNNSQNKNTLIRYTSIYIAFSLMFVLRGSLMASYSYICGSIFTFVYFPSVINAFYYKYFRFKLVKTIKG